MSEPTLIMRDISLQRRIRRQRYNNFCIYANKNEKTIRKSAFFSLARDLYNKW